MSFVINASPVEIINFGDNLHSGTLSRGLFCRYVLPAYQRRCERLHAAGKFGHSHWDGDTKSLLPFAQETGLDGIEAITPQPQGDVTLEEIKAALGDQMFLLDGIPAVYFDAEYPVSALEECPCRLIELIDPRLVLGISDEISSHGDIERVRVVNRIVEEYNAAQRRETRVSGVTGQHRLPSALSDHPSTGCTYLRRDIVRAVSGTGRGAEEGDRND